MDNSGVKPNKTHFSETANQLMTGNVPVIKKNLTIAELETYLQKETVNFESINYIYIVNGDGLLEGVLSIKEMYRLGKSTVVGDVMVKDVISVRSHTDQERVAYLALKHNLKAVPVIDKDSKFLGVITPDVIMSILDTEAVENILRFGGITHFGNFDNIFKLPLLVSLKHRLPWLIIGLFGGILASGIISGFEEILKQNLLLVAFIPLIVYMASATGTQMEAFVIRDLAIEPKTKFIPYFVRQLLVVFVIGVIASLVLYGISFVMHGDASISLILAVALMLAILSSVVTGLAIPFMFEKISLDPANASGPIATILQDILSILVYFTVATWLL